MCSSDLAIAHEEKAGAGVGDGESAIKSIVAGGGVTGCAILGGRDRACKGAAIEKEGRAHRGDAPAKSRGGTEGEVAGSRQGKILCRRTRLDELAKQQRTGREAAGAYGNGITRGEGRGSGGITAAELDPLSIGGIDRDVAVEDSSG